MVASVRREQLVMVAPKQALVCVVDDDAEIRGALDSLLRSFGFSVRTYEAPEDFVACGESDAASCLLLDVQLKGADGLEFQKALVEDQILVPVILMTGHGSIPMTVRAMKAGAVDFLSKPFDDDVLLAAVVEAISRDRQRREGLRQDESLKDRFETLTPREREVMSLVTAGLMNKQIAGRLDLSEVTVKIHRGNMMRKMAADSLADLVRMAETLNAREASVSRFRTSRQ